MKKILITILVLYSICPLHLNYLLGREKDRIKISFVGDIIMHGAVKACALINNRIEGNRSINNRGFDYLFERIRPYFEDSDIVIGNMEFPVSPPFIGRGLVFNCLPEIIPAMKRSGFNMLTIANNHILDHGKRGLLDTIRFLKRYGVDFIGVNRIENAARSGIVIEINGIRIGFIAYTGLLNYGVPKNNRGYYINDFYNKDNVKEDIREIKQNSDYLIMIAHRGVEYKSKPQKKDTVIMKEYLEHGVDLIVGHHPHVLQYVEKYITSGKRETYIFYSLGNFMSNQRFSYRMSSGSERYTTQESIILNLYLYRNGGHIRGNFEVLPIWTLNFPSIKGKRRFSNIQAVYLPDRIIGLAGEMAIADYRKKKAISKEMRYLNSRIDVIKRILFNKHKFEEIKIGY